MCADHLSLRLCAIVFCLQRMWCEQETDPDPGRRVENLSAKTLNFHAFLISRGRPTSVCVRVRIIPSWPLVFVAFDAPSPIRSRHVFGPSNGKRSHVARSF